MSSRTYHEAHNRNNGHVIAGSRQAPSVYRTGIDGREGVALSVSALEDFACASAVKQTQGLRLQAVDDVPVLRVEPKLTRDDIQTHT